MTFNEANTVEAFIRDRLCGGITEDAARLEAAAAARAKEDSELPPP